MAKQSSAKGANSRIRFIMLEAEMPEGDLAQVVSAIQNALKPATNSLMQRPRSADTTSALPNPIQDSEVEIDGVAYDLDHDEPPEAPRPAKETKPRKPQAVKVLDIDLSGDPSFADFAVSHPPKNDTERNLVVLAWFKEFRPDEPITAHHVYTCYRAVKWPASISDFSSILRSLKAQQLVKSTARGQYEINHLGIARVEKMKAPA